MVDRQHLPTSLGSVDIGKGPRVQEIRAARNFVDSYLFISLLLLPFLDFKSLMFPEISVRSHLSGFMSLFT